MRYALKSLMVFLLVGCSLRTALGQQPGSSAVLPASAALLKKVVAFLDLEAHNNIQRPFHFQGTGFWVFYEDKRFGEQGGFVYLVTNRHVAEPRDDNGVPLIVDKTSVRVNLQPKTGSQQSSEVIALPIGNQLHWYFPDDPAVDLAVLPVTSSQEKVDFVPIPVSMFATRDVVQSRNISEGDSVLFAGLFYLFPGVQRMEPIVRHGVIAMMPEEKRCS